jgi:IS5 family transposase
MTALFSEVHAPHAAGVSADKAYDSAANFELIRESGQRPAIIPKHKRGKMGNGLNLRERRARREKSG